MKEVTKPLEEEKIHKRRTVGSVHVSKMMKSDKHTSSSSASEMPPCDQVSMAGEIVVATVMVNYMLCNSLMCICYPRAN